MQKDAIMMIASFCVSRVMYVALRLSAAPNIASRPLRMAFEEANIQNSTATGNLAVVTFRINNNAPIGRTEITVIPEAAGNRDFVRSPLVVTSGSVNIT